MKKWKTVSKLKIKKEDFKIDEIIRILFKNRGISTKKEIERFLNPRIEDVTIDSVGIDRKEIDKTIKRIKKAILKNETIIVYGDYDVDGICGTAIVWETIYSSYKNVKPYIPHRMDEGYGLSLKGIENLKSKNENCKLIITVDNGIVAHEAVEFANKQGVDVIVTDHHVKESKLPKAYSIVHSTKLCGTGIAWLLAKQIRNSKFLPTGRHGQIPNNSKTQGFNTENEKGINDDSSLELVALATIADLVPLIGANRTLVKFGLEDLRKTKRFGLIELFKESGIQKDQIGTYEIGHIIAPRINAMGRVSHGMDSLRLICTKNPSKARDYAMILGSTNKDRQLLTQETALHASSIFSNGEFKSKIIFVSNREYNQGVIGLVASKLVDQFYRPSFVLSIGDTYAKGSARSIKGVNVIELIRSVSHTLVQAGGHPMAAGFTVEIERIEEFRSALEKKADEIIDESLFNRSILIDMPLEFENISYELYEAIQKLSPFGMGNPEPVFISENITVEDIRRVGREKKHLKLRLRQKPKHEMQNTKYGYFNAIAFGFGQDADIKTGDEIDMAYIIDKDSWSGNNKLQLKIRDLKSHPL